MKAVLNCYCVIADNVNDYYLFTRRQDHFSFGVTVLFVSSSDEYDDVQPITEDFPPPPPEIRYLLTSG